MAEGPGVGPTLVIPTKDGAETIGSCLEGWIDQTIRPSSIIVIDSGSTDGTVEIAKRHEVVEIVPIAPKHFDHGETRNYGASLSGSEFTAFSVQDAIPADREVLQRMLACFDSPEVAGVCGCQIIQPRPECNPVDWFAPVSEPVNRRYQYPSARSYDLASLRERRAAASWDNVLALYRTSVVANKVRFRRTKFGEDALWAIDALRSGYELVYCPLARVHHYHHESAAYAERRLLEELYLRYIAFGEIPTKNEGIGRDVRAARALIKRNVGFGQMVYWLRYNLARNRGYRRAIRAFVNACRQGPDAVVQLMGNKCELPSLGRASTDSNSPSEVV